MATKKFLHDIDLQSVGQLKNARIQNVTSSDIVSLAGSLGATNRGMLVYNTTDKALYTWNGTAFDKYTFDIVGDIMFKGIINPNLSSTIVPVSGHQYVVDTAGALSTQLGAITYTPSANVEVGDVVLFTSATTATIIERNLEQATETTLGTIRISSQAEVDAGSIADEAVTPATLHGYVDPEFTADRARLTTVEADVGTVESGLAAELLARAAADTTLQGNISSEATARAAADTTLQGNIDAEATARASAVSGEASARSAADVVLQDNIDDEASARAAADTTLQGNIDAEASTRASAVTTLQGNIDSEASTRASAVSALQSRATALEARDEVFVYTASVDLTADTSYTVNHNLDLTNKDSFTINTMHNGDQVSLQVTSVNVNSLTLTSAVSVAGLVVSIIGF